MLNRTEGLIIGFDCANDKDIACLIVSRIFEGKVKVINIFYGKTAEDEYQKLIGIKESSKNI